MNATGHSAELAPDAERLRALHDKHADYLLSYVARLTHDRVGAQDVVQETLLRAWRNGAMLERAGDSGRGWMVTVARRIVIDQWRLASRSHEVLTGYTPEPQVEDPAQHSVDRQLVHAALQTLSPQHRQTLFQCYFRGASIAQAAETLGLPPGTVKSRTHYALRALRRAIDELEGVTTTVDPCGAR